MIGDQNTQAVTEAEATYVLPVDSFFEDADAHRNPCEELADARSTPKG
jgi:hypothetical protein